MGLFFVPVLGRLDVLFAGLRTTALISLAAILLALTLGTGLALLRRAPARPVRLLAVAYIDLFRNTPFLVQLFFFYYGLPEIGVTLDAVPTGIVALGLATAPNAAEILRAGIEGVDPGVIEAARAAAFSPWQRFRHVVLPIAARFAIRPLGSVFINLVLTTSVLSTITVDELMSNAETLASDTFRPFEVYILVLGLYCLLTFALSGAFGLASAGWVRRSADRAVAR